MSPVVALAAVRCGANVWTLLEVRRTRRLRRVRANATWTRVLFEHTGFEQERSFKGAEYGWNMMHGKLAKKLAQQRSFQ